MAEERSKHYPSGMQMICIWQGEMENNCMYPSACTNVARLITMLPSALIVGIE